MLRQWRKALRDQYVNVQVQRSTLPNFPPDRLCRYRIIFSGRVQHVGFRMESAQLADRLGLTGFCENLPNGDVLGEFQGPENRIRFLVFFTESLKRIVIEQKTVEEIPVLPSDRGFECR